MARTYRLLVALIAGVILGAILHGRGESSWIANLQHYVLQPIGQIFLRLILMAVVPLVFSALVLGVFELGRTHGLARIAVRTLIFTAAFSTISVLIGVTLVNTLQPGRGLPLDRATFEKAGARLATSRPATEGQADVVQSFVELIPTNPVDTAAKALRGDILPFMCFALIFGIALARATRIEDEAPILVRVLEQVMAVSMRIVDYALVIAPLGVFAIVFGTVFASGIGVLRLLAMYVAVVVCGLAIQLFLVYGLSLKFLGGSSPLEFFRRCRTVLLYAFSTASSNATLPVALETAERDLSLPPRISRFVLTVGATANQNGTALFEGVTILFLAQVYGVELSAAKQATVMILSILAGIGTAGVPGGSLPMIMMVLHSIGVPPEGIGLILGADRLLDMCRTVVNVGGDLTIAALVSAGEKREANLRTV